MINERALAKVEEHIRDAVAKGAKVLTGGERHARGGTFFQPTVLTGATNSMKLSSEETFGPVIPIMKVNDAEEALKLANDSRYGLHGYVSGRDIERARRVAGQILAGRVVINGMTDDPQAPWGGFKYSGIGREYGAFGIEAFVETRAILDATV